MKNLISSIVLLGIITLLVWMLSTPSETLIQENVTTSGGIDAYMNNFSMKTLTEDGRPAMSIDAERLELDNESGQASLRFPDIKVVDSTRQNWRITADAGAMDQQGRILELSNKVLIRNTDGEPIRIETERLRIEVDTQLISSQHQVLLTTADTSLRSEGMLIDNVSGTLELLEEVRGRHVPE